MRYYREFLLTNKIEMKKMITLLTIVLLFCRVLFAPEFRTIAIPEAESIDPYKRLIHAIGMVEGRCDTLAYNPDEGAVGFFQIRPIRLKDYNKRTGSHYVMRDMLDYYKAEKVFLYYAREIGYPNYEKIAKNWNGSGPMTKVYWKKVQAFL
jgi:hypothetical protein